MRPRLGDQLPEKKPHNIEHALDLLGIEYDGDKYGSSYRDIQLTMRCPIPGHPDNRKSFSVNSGTGQWCCYASTSCGGGHQFGRLVFKVYGGKVRMRHINRWLDLMYADGRVEPVLSDGGKAPAPPPLRVRMSDEEFFETYPLPPARVLNNRVVSEDAARELSIGWDKAKGAFVFPARDPETFDIIGWEYKAASVWSDPGTKKSRTLFGIDAFDRSSGSAILVESPVDVAVLRTAGFTEGLSSWGKQVSRTHQDLLRKLAPRRLYLALDNDKDGQAAQEKLIERMSDHALYVFNYGCVDRYEKDLGGMEDDEIFEAVRTARRARS